MNNKTVTKETREEGIERRMANYAKARLLEIDMPVFAPKNNGIERDLYYVGDATVKISAIIASTLMYNLRIRGTDKDGDFACDVFQLMLEGGHVLYTNQVGDDEINDVKRRGEVI